MKEAQRCWRGYHVKQHKLALLEAGRCVLGGFFGENPISRYNFLFILYIFHFVAFKISECIKFPIYHLCVHWSHTLNYCAGLGDVVPDFHMFGCIFLCGKLFIANQTLQLLFAQTHHILYPRIELFAFLFS